MKLRKADVEALLATFDDDPVEALTIALRRVLDHADASFDELIRRAPFEPRRVEALAARNQAALDSLAAELNELRDLAQ